MSQNQSNLYIYLSKIFRKCTLFGGKQPCYTFFTIFKSSRTVYVLGTIALHKAECKLGMFKVLSFMLLLWSNSSCCFFAFFALTKIVQPIQSKKTKFSQSVAGISWLSLCVNQWEPGIWEWLSSFNRQPVTHCTYGVIQWKKAANIIRISLRSIPDWQESRRAELESQFWQFMRKLELNKETGQLSPRVSQTTNKESMTKL